MPDERKAYFTVAAVPASHKLPFDGLLKAAQPDVGRGLGDKVVYVVTGKDAIAQFEAALRNMFDSGAYTCYNRLPAGFHESDIHPWVLGGTFSDPFDVFFRRR